MRLASTRSSNASPTASLTPVQTLKTSRPFARFAPASAVAATTILKNSLRVLASTQDLVCVSKTARTLPQKGASIYKDYSRVVKVEPTVATRKETLARPRREEPVVTRCLKTYLMQQVGPAKHSISSAPSDIAVQGDREQRVHTTPLL